MRALLLLLILLVPSAAMAQSVDKAYQKEFAYLQAQKAALAKRVATLERENARERNAAQAEVNALQGQLIAAQMKADGMQEQLAEIDREATRGDEHNESLLAVFEQSRSSLARYDVEVPSPENPSAADVRAVFAAAMPVLEQGGAVRTERGPYFLASGQKAEAEITYVGRIAAFAGDTALAPAGDGRLKVWAGGKAGGIFLFESIEKAVEEKAEKTWLDTIEAGGIIAWVIVALGAMAALLASWRMIALFRARSPRELVDEACRLVRVGRFAEAKRLTSNASGAAARVMTRTIAVLEEPREVAEDAIGEAVLDEMPAIDRFGTAIMVFAAVAPLLGLLGTVTGMIATFDIITEFGTGDPKMLSGGISEALITTQLGLMVAIPALLVGNLLNASAAGLVDGLEQAALRLVNATRIDAEPVVQSTPVLAVDGDLAEAAG